VLEKISGKSCFLITVGYIWTKYVLNIFSQKICPMTSRETFGDHIRLLREQHKLPLRKVAAALDIDQSTLGKIERGERSANKDMIRVLSTLFNVDESELNIIYLSDRVAYELMEEGNAKEILAVAEEKIKYLKAKKFKQGSLNLK
jgi:transcriptional regulator with XRE-family HTH domain